MRRRQIKDKIVYFSWLLRLAPFINVWLKRLFGRAPDKADHGANFLNFWLISKLSIKKSASFGNNGENKKGPLPSPKRHPFVKSSITSKYLRGDARAYHGLVWQPGQIALEPKFEDMEVLGEGEPSRRWLGVINIIRRFITRHAGNAGNETKRG